MSEKYTLVYFSVSPFNILVSLAKTNLKFATLNLAHEGLGN